MTIFAVFRVAKPELLGPAIAREFPNDHLALGQDEWLISADLTPNEVSDRIGITTDPSETGSAIVFSMRSYFGRAPSNVWDWIKTKTEASGG